jgi:hypothetical protein
MYTVAFLRHVLAETGWICIDIKLQQGFGHRFFGDFDQAAAYIHDQDAKGETVYFAISTFKEPTTRKQVNVAYLKSFIGDCDVGPDKSYKTRAEAVGALNDFLAVTSLPAPTIVHSGRYGLHLYWTLEEPLTPEQWRPRAEAFRALCKQHGFQLDHSRTADHSSVLRPVGTHNRKQGPDDWVMTAEVASPVWLGDLRFGSKLDGQQHAPVRPTRLLDDAVVYHDLPSDAHKIKIECAQIKNFCDQKGHIPYDLWLYSIWTLHFTTQGDAFAHEYSQGHPNYSYEETQSKLDQATSPIKCQTFSQHNDLCKSCQHWGKISTPLQLGRVVATAPVKINDAPNDLYRNDERGLFLCSEKTDKQGKVIANNTMISRFPIYLDAVCRSERGSDHSLVFRMPTPHRGDVSIIIPSGVLASSQGIPEMHRMGAVIHHPDHFRDFAKKRKDEYELTRAPQMQYQQFGWKDDSNAFLVGNQLYTQSQILTVPCTPELERRARMLGPRGGSLAAWSAAANKLFATGCEPQSFALCCSFGALLMHFISEEGGAIVNLVSETTGTGKTTGLEAVASVWGELDGIRLLDEDTQVSRAVTLGTLGNLPCVFDELHKRDPDSIRQFVTVFTSGRDKMRARPDGTLRDPGEWQTILVVASNISLTDIMQVKNNEEAQAFRVLELICETTFTGTEGDKLRRELMENRGWAGDAFIKHLMQPGMLQSVLSDIEMVTQALWDPFYGFDTTKHRFWVRAFACALVAGRIINHMGILDFNPTRIVGYAIERCQERNRNESKRDNVTILSEALYEIWSSTLVVDIEWKAQSVCHVLNAPAPNRAFLARRVRDSGRIYVMRTWLRKWLVERNINYNGFINYLKTERVIVNDKKLVTLGAGTEHSGGGQIACVEIDTLHPAMTKIPRIVPVMPARAPDADAPSLPSASQ